MQEALRPNIQKPITKQYLVYRLKPKQMIPNNPRNLYLVALNIHFILLNNPLLAHKQ